MRDEPAHVIAQGRDAWETRERNDDDFLVNEQAHRLRRVAADLLALRRRETGLDMLVEASARREVADGPAGRFGVTVLDTPLGM
jgi:hypothetical protein